ncbi:MAG: hypothetical protein WCR97_01760 [Bacilli bacterium]
MPSSLTHYEFMKHLGIEYTDISIIGTQGPDPFFFYGLSLIPHLHAKKINSFGHFLHNIDSYITFRYFVEYIQGALDSEKPVLIDYLKGMYAHYVLDKHCHPYIFYISGFTVDAKDKTNYFLPHAAIETSIDVLLLQKLGDSSLKSQDALICNNKKIKIVSKMICSLANDRFKKREIKENSFYKAVKQMRFVEKVLYSKSGRKKKFFNHFMHDSAINVMARPKTVMPLDFLNLKHKTFYNCVTNKDPQNKDFYELMDDAKKEFFVKYPIIVDVINKKKTMNSMDNLFNSIDHNGFEVGTTKKYFDLIFK